jgi:hypothetical protein
MLMKKQMRIMEKTEIHILRTASGYRMTDHTFNEDIRE